MRGRRQAVLAVSAFGMLGVLIPPLVMISGALVGLATLRNGVVQALVVSAGAVAVFAVASLFLNGLLGVGVKVALFVWLPVLMLCEVLRRTVSQPFTFVLAGALAIVGILGFHVVVGDTGLWWRNYWDEAIVSGLDRLGEQPPSANIHALMQVLDFMSLFMTGVVAAAVMFSALITVLIARWFHAVLDNPNGFGNEFRALKLDRRLPIVVAVSLALGLFANDLTNGFGWEVLCVAMVLYFFQGIAIVHGVVAQLGASVGWLVLLYLLLIVLWSPMAFALSLTGFVDTWLDIRERIGSKANQR